MRFFINRRSWLLGPDIGFPVKETAPRDSIIGASRVKDGTSVQVSGNRVLVGRRVPDRSVVEAIPDRGVPDHDAQQVLVDGSLGQRGDGGGGGGALGPKQDGVRRCRRGHWETLLENILSALYSYGSGFSLPATVPGHLRSS